MKSQLSDFWKKRTPRHDVDSQGAHNGHCFVGPNHGNLRASPPQRKTVRPCAMQGLINGLLLYYFLRGWALRLPWPKEHLRSLGDQTWLCRIVSWNFLGVGHESYTIGAESENRGCFFAPKSKVPTLGEFESVKNCTTHLHPLKVRAVLFFYDNLFCCRKKRYDFPWQLW